MKKSSITGWRDIFSFTLIQTIKSKAYIISFVIFAIMAIGVMPIITFINSKDSGTKVEENSITKVYVYNNTSLVNEEFKPIFEQESLSHISIVITDVPYDELLETIESKENTSIVMSINEEAGSYQLSFVKASEGPIEKQDVEVVSIEMLNYFNEYRMKSLGIKEEQLAMIHSEIITKVSLIDTSGVEVIEEDTSISKNQYGFIYGLLLVVLMVNTLASSQIAVSIISDKSSKVLEYLLTSIRPLALMVGKILAMLCSVLIQFVGAIILFLISNLITSKFIATGDNLLKDYLSADLFSNLNIINILFCLIMCILGLIFYATLAGLAGSTVSRIEESSEGLTLFTFTSMIGAYVGIGAAAVLVGSGVNAYVIFALLFPLSAPFILPGAILIGKANLLIVILAIVFQVIVIALLFKFVAKVYETLIYHNGNRIGIKELIKISKTV